MLNNSGINKVILVGYVAKQPRRHTIDNVQTLCFPLVTQEYIKKNSDKTEHLEWHQIKMPLNTISAEHYVNKGDCLYLQGKIQTQQFTDDMGIRRYKTEIIATMIQPMIMKRPELVSTTGMLNNVTEDID